MDPTQISPLTVVEELESNVRSIPDNLAVIDSESKFTFDDLYSRICDMTLKVTEKSSGADFVVILLPQGVNFITTLYAVFKSNLTAVPIDVGNSAAQINFILEELGNPLLITALEYLGKVPSHSNIMTVEDVEGLPERNRTETRTQDRNELALIVFTSGSTGIPKGVKITHTMLYRLANSPWSRTELRGSERSLTYSSPGFVLSFSEYIPLLSRGCTVCVPPTEYRQDLDRLHEYINRHEITMVTMTTSAGLKMMDRPMPSLRWMRLGGEKLTVPIDDSKNFKIMYLYGCTETFSIAVRQTFPANEVPNCGQIVPGVSIVFLDETGACVKDGEPGEICVASPMVTAGYLNRPELNDQRYVKNPKNPAQTLYRTGDVGYLTPNDELVVIGRVDFQVKIMGNRLELGQVEYALTQHPAIKQAAVIAVSKGSTNTLCAFCLSESDSFRPDLNELCAYLENHLPRYGHPSQLTWLDSLPVTTSGKVDRQTLKSLNVTKVIVPLVTMTECQIAQVWADTLKIPVEDIGRSDTFFSLGGNSLQLALVVTKLQSAPWFLNVRIKHLFKVPRIDLFAELVDAAKSGTADLAGMVKNNEYIDFTKDLSLDADFPAKIEHCSLPSNPVGNTVLLTGVTGYVGANFLKVLLERTSALVHCIIRAKTNDLAKWRLETALKKFGVEIPVPLLATRVQCFAGDVSHHKFSIPREDYSALCQQIDVVYHFAAEVHFLKYYSEMRDSNVVGTRKILKFCIESKLKSLHFVSTFSVVGGSCPDHVILEGPEPLHRIKEEESHDMGYSQSKRVGEKLVWSAISRGLPGVVYRLGEIGAHSELRVVNKADFLARLFTTCKNIGCYPLIDRRLPYGSVDSTCELILSVAEQGFDWIGKGFHVYEKQLSYLDAFSQLDGAVGVELGEWMKKVLEAIESSEDSVKQEDYSILLQLMQNSTSGGGSALDKKFLQENLFAAVNSATSGRKVNFNRNQDWKRYLNVLFEKN